jgi:hypothetical protein
MEIWANQEWPVGMATREREANCEVKKQRERAAEVGRAGQGRAPREAWAAHTEGIWSVRPQHKQCDLNFSFIYYAKEKWLL